MDKLKPGQKFCKNCNDVNPIRSFKCKSCNTEFSVKPNPKAQNKSIDSFFTQNKSNIKKVEIVYQDKNDNTNQLQNLIKDYSPQNNITNNNQNFNIDNIITKNESNIKIYLKDYIHSNLNNNFASDFIKISNDYIFALIFYNKSNFNFILSLIYLDSELNIIDNQAKLIENNFEKEAFVLNIKFLENTSLFLLTINNLISIYIVNESKSIIEINRFELFNSIISKTSLCLFKNNTLNVLVTDNNYKIFYLNTNVIESIDNIELDLVSIYEKQFSAKITQIKFINDTDLFCVSALDGYLKIFSINDIKRPIFNYKSTEIWITDFEYSINHRLIIFSVNSPERLFGIKFYNDKEFLVKRVLKTDRSSKIYLNQEKFNLYYTNTDNLLQSFNLNEMIYLFKSYKSSDKRDFLIKTYNKQQNNIESIDSNNNLNRGMELRKVLEAENKIFVYYSDFDSILIENLNI